MKTRLLRTGLCCCLLTLFQPAHAQSFKKAYKWFSNGDYPAAAPVFERYRQHEKYGAAARYFLARIRLSRERALAPLLDIDGALIESGVLLQLLTPKQALRQQRKFGFDTTAILTLRLDAQRWAIAYTRARGTLPVLDSLLTGLPKPLPELTPELERAHGDIVNTNLETHDYDTMTAILRRHIGYVLPENYGQTRRMAEEIWPAFQAKYPLCSLDLFAWRHPKSFAGRDCWKEPARKVLCTGDLATMLEFHDANRWTALEVVLLNAIAERATDSLAVAALSPKYRQHLADIRQRNALRERLRTGSAERDTAAALAQALDYIQHYAPRYSAFRLMEETLQFLLERRLYASAIRLLEDARGSFPDELPVGCTTNFDYQLRVKPWIDGKLPILRQPERPFARRALRTLNTDDGEETNPVVSADGQEIYFAATGRPDNRAGQDVFRARRDTATGDWAAPALVPELSGPGNQAPLSITADGRQMLLYVNNRLQISRRAQRGTPWGAPAPLPVEGIAVIGKGFLSADGNTLILEGAYSAGSATQAPDLDLFFSLRDPATGQWSRPGALGADINTDEEEGNPFLSPDGKTLWYTSTGYPGLGRSDVFVSQRTGPDWTHWRRPDNLGKEVNDTLLHRGFNTVSADGKKAWMSAGGELWEVDLSGF